MPISWAAERFGGINKRNNYVAPGLFRRRNEGQLDFLSVIGYDHLVCTNKCSYLEHFIVICIMRIFECSYTTQEDNGTCLFMLSKNTKCIHSIQEQYCNLNKE